MEAAGVGSENAMTHGWSLWGRRKIDWQHWQLPLSRQRRGGGERGEEKRKKDLIAELQENRLQILFYTMHVTVTCHQHIPTPLPVLLQTYGQLSAILPAL